MGRGGAVWWIAPAATAEMYEEGSSSNMGRRPGKEMRHARRGRYATHELGGSGEDSFVAVVVTKLTGALLFILLLTMVIMALIPRADTRRSADVAEQDAPPLTITTLDRLPDALAGRPYALALAVSGARGAIEWSLAGPLPVGIVWDGERGTLEGTPASPTDQPIALEVAASDGHAVARRVVTLAVLDPSAVASTTAEEPTAPSLRSWLEHGFGYLILLLVWLLGLGVVGSLERWSASSGGRRFLAYRAVVSLAAMSAAGALWLWLRGPIG